MDHRVLKYSNMFKRAKEHGLGTTIHTGETAATSGEGVIAVEHLKPDRIGHGIRAAYNPDAIKMLADTQTVLEICPTSNLHTRAVTSIDEFHHIMGTFVQHDVPITINTDGTYLCKTNLSREFEIIRQANILNDTELEKIRLRAFEASFINTRS